MDLKYVERLLDFLPSNWKLAYDGWDAEPPIKDLYIVEITHLCHTVVKKKYFYVVATVFAHGTNPRFVDRLWYSPDADLVLNLPEGIDFRSVRYSPDIKERLDALESGAII